MANVEVGTEETEAKTLHRVGGGLMRMAGMARMEYAGRGEGGVGSGHSKTEQNVYSVAM